MGSCIVENGYKVDDVSSFLNLCTTSLGLALPLSASAAHILFIPLTVLGQALHSHPGLHSNQRLPSSKRGDSPPSPLCQTTSRVIVEHSVNIPPFTIRTSMILRHFRPKTANIPIISDARITTQANYIYATRAKVFHHPLPIRRHQGTNVSIAPFRYL